MSFRSDLDALILGALQDGPLHGYAIVKDIRTRSAGALTLGEGQLYPVLHRLEEEGKIAASWQPQEGKPARKIYDLTSDGRKELLHKTQMWEKFVSGVNAVLGGRRSSRSGSNV